MAWAWSRSPHLLLTLLALLSKMTLSPNYLFAPFSVPVDGRRPERGARMGRMGSPRGAERDGGGHAGVNKCGYQLEGC